MNQVLRRALDDARLRDADVAARLGVDPKTVQRWVAGRVPHARHRWAVADLLGRGERDLWPDRDEPIASVSREVKATYPYRSAVPREEWLGLFGAAETEIAILVYAALFLAEDVEMVRLLTDRARAGVTVRLLLADPDSPRLADRGEEEGIGSAVAARVRNARTLFRPLLDTAGVQARQHETVLYNSIFRADEEMLVNPQVHGIAAAYAPVLHLRRTELAGMFDTYVDSYERVWASGVRLDGVDSRSGIG
ncbi:MAG: XRE family transcriptional regulator [Dehalococcoidia bacterium]